jgi:hypothetical protein
MKPSQGCTVGGEALWSYFEPKIPIYRTNSSGPVPHKFSSCAYLPRWFGGRPFSAVLPPLRLTAHSNVGPYPEQPSHESHCSQFLQLKDALPAVRPQLSPFRPWKPCATWTQNNVPISCPQHLQRFGTKLSEFRAEFNCVTLFHIAPHFANVPTATKVRTQLRKSDVWLTVHRNSVWIRKTN